MLYSVRTAKSQLSKLIAAAVAGEEVVIAKGSKPVVRLVAIPQSGFRFGVLAGKAGMPPRFLRVDARGGAFGMERPGRSGVSEVLLDTHAWVWSFADEGRLSDRARSAIEAAEAGYVSPISFLLLSTSVTPHRASAP